MPDHYTYPGTEVLVNIPGYTDPAAWKEAETAVIGLRARELARSPIPGGFDLEHLQAVHARLVEGFYTWGGRLRDTNTGPGGTGIAHCLPEFIPAEAGKVFDALAEEDHLRGRDRAEFSRGLATAWGDLTAVQILRDRATSRNAHGVRKFPAPWAVVFTVPARWQDRRSWPHGGATMAPPSAPRGRTR